MCTYDVSNVESNASAKHGWDGDGAGIKEVGTAGWHLTHHQQSDGGGGGGTFRRTPMIGVHFRPHFHNQTD